MTNSSLPAHLEDPGGIARRLIQNAHTGDGLPELVVGLSFLSISGLSYWQALEPRAVLALVFLVPILCFGGPWVVRRVRGANIRKFGYMQPDPMERKQIVPGIVAAAMMVALIAFTELLHPRHGTLAGTGFLGGLITAYSGRRPRFVIGGLLLAALGVALDKAAVSLPIGFADLFGMAGLYALVSGIIVFLRFQAR
jgi:hypothetical protein